MRAAAANFEPGTELDDGKYRIVRFLGAGAMGAVFEAENTLTGGRVAIKCVRLSLDVRDSAGPRLLQEARMAARIRHPNVVHVYDVIRWEGHLGLVMEYLAGEPLTQHLSEQGLPVDRALSLLLPIMRGVAAAHRQGVIHRDIKPDNIFLSREEDSPHPVPKLLDFGIAKIGLAELDKSALTRSGQVIGTPLYMSLEQFRAEKDIDARTDVYALGVVLYQALTGRTPFEASTLPHLIVKLTSTVPPSPRSLRPELPEELSALVMHAIARERTDRVPSIESLIRGLDPFGPRERDSGGAWPAHPRESWTVQPTQAAQSSEAHALSPRRRTGVVALGSLIAAATAALLFLPRALPPATITRPPATARPEPAPKSNHTAETAAIDIGSVWARPAPAELSDRDASVLPDSSAASPTDAGAAGSNVSVSKLRHKVVRKERPPGPSPAPTPGLETQPVVQAIASDAKRSDDARERDEQPKLRIRLPTSPEF